MLTIDFTFVWTAINLLILYLFLRKVLFRRVGDFMDRRARAIADDMEAGRAMKAEGLALREQCQAMLDDAAAQRTRLLEETRLRADREYEQIIAAAREEAANMLASARENAAREQALMAAGMKDQVASLALLAASKVMEANMDTESNRALVTGFLEKEGVA